MERLTLGMLSILRTPPMLRTVFIAFLLTALTAVSASGVKAASSTRTHKRSVPARAVHRTAHRPSANAPRHTARSRSRYVAHRYSTSSRRRPTFRRVRAERLRPSSRYARPVAEDAVESPTPDTQLAANDVPESAAPAATPEPALAPGSTPAPKPASAPDTTRPAPLTPTQAASLRSPRIFPIAPLRGSHGSLVRQNEKSEADDLERIENDEDLNDRIARGMLVPIPASVALIVNGNLPPNRRYCRPWTASFLTNLARAHQTQFHHPLEVSSAVRTVEYQKRLMEVNGNAAAAEGDVVSPHVTGATIDIAKSGLSQREIYWMRDHLLPLQNAGKIDVEEEFQQACFHITVYKTYVTPRSLPKARRHAADTPQSPAAVTPHPPPPDTPSTSSGIASSGI